MITGQGGVLQIVGPAGNIHRQQRLHGIGIALRLQAEVVIHPTLQRRRHFGIVRVIGGEFALGVFAHHPGPASMPVVLGGDQLMRLGNVDKKIVSQQAIPASPVLDAHWDTDKAVVLDSDAYAVRNL